MEIDVPGKHELTMHGEPAPCQQQVQRSARKVVEVAWDVVKAVPKPAEQARLQAVEARQRDEQPASRTKKSGGASQGRLRIRQVLEHVPKGQCIKSAWCQFPGVYVPGK